VSFSSYVIINEADKKYQILTWPFSLDWASEVDYLTGDTNALHNFISNISIDNKQPDSNHYSLLFKIGHYIFCDHQSDMFAKIIC
jgi:hypothetical protein